jgi:protein import protein ZIM17
MEKLRYISRCCHYTVRLLTRNTPYISSYHSMTDSWQLGTICGTSKRRRAHTPLFSYRYLSVSGNTDATVDDGIGSQEPSDTNNKGPTETANGHTVGKIESPRLCIVYTCKVCQTRSSKTFSKLAYTKGIVIVRCPGCESLHLIADNLGWFKHFEHRNVEDMLKAKGEKVIRNVDSDDTLELTPEDAGHCEQLN